MTKELDYVTKKIVFSSDYKQSKTLNMKNNRFKLISLTSIALVSKFVIQNFQ